MRIRLEVSNFGLFSLLVSKKFHQELKYKRVKSKFHKRFEYITEPTFKKYYVDKLRCKLKLSSMNF